MPKSRIFKKVRQIGTKTTENAIKRDPEKTLLGNFCGTMTLHTLQDKIKRQPDLYKNEFQKHFELFQEKLAVFK